MHRSLTVYFHQRQAESNSMKKIIFSLLLVTGLINTASAVEGNIEAGKAKSGMCAACHGANGLNPSPNFPNLAGQHADYIAKQLQSFKAGNRTDAMMAPMAAGLSEQDMADLGAFYASQSRSGEKPADATTVAGNESVAAAPKFVADAAIGKSIYELGDASRSIAACISCHGKEGRSDVLVYPNLAKQHSAYIEKQLQNFKAGTRKDPAMNQFAAALSNEEIQHIGAYFVDTKAVANVKVRQPVVSAALTEHAVAGKVKAAACGACHGSDGNALVAMYPKLAGQNAIYIAKQLADFKAGDASGRNDPVMAGMVAALSEQDMLELGSYFASQKSSAGNGKANDLGKQLYFGGDAARGITACAACHGVMGKGMAKAGFPSVAGQHTDYLVSQLAKFKQKSRSNDKNKMMRSIAKKLKKADVDALTQFMSSL